MNKWILGFKVISESTVRQWLVVCDLRLQVLGDSPQVGWATPSGHHTSIPIPLWKLTLNLPVFIWKSQSLIPTSSSLFSAAHYHHNAKYCLETDPALHFSSTFQTFYCVFRNGCTILSESHYIFMVSECSLYLLAWTETLLLPEDTTPICLSVSFCLYMPHLSLSYRLFYHYQTTTSVICFNDIIFWPADNSLSFIRDFVIRHTVFFSTLSTVIIPGNSHVFRDGPSNNWHPCAHHYSLPSHPRHSLL